ncbi:cytochrome P450 [Wolfiporia cocos MD-104 SS10]|uniref:Cytochrome P450 n=1 Tax=Wolfiporia cocos (strain MD-104) TaxID=742152 RepID=A0A2H3J9W5_WOLCO|nr:cytochrome P450 [Wolfiporia cocos MD-104 SS10]
MYADLVVLAGVAVATVIIFYVNGFKRAQSRLPDGPRGVPIFGNLFQVPPLRPHPKFLEWAQQYGPAFRVIIGQKNIIVLNTAEAADELLANRSKIYSGRPAPHVAMDIVSDGQRMVFLPYDREWKVVRRSVQGILGPSPSRKLRTMQELESRVTIYDLMCHRDQSVNEIHIQGPNGEVPERHWFALIRRYTTSVVMHLSYGQRIHRLLNNPDVHKIYDVIGNFSRVSQPGHYLADIFSILRMLPDCLAPWRSEGRKMHDWEMQLWGRLFSESRVDMANGIARTGFVHQYLRSRAEAGLEDLPGNGVTTDSPGWMHDKMLAYTAASMLEAGSDTTAATIETFVLLMLSNQEALKRAREEIDQVVGTERMPTWEDEEALPWMVACIKETMRRRPPTIMGVPHRADEDDIFGGYFIPKGSAVIGNIWAIHMDPARYPNPTAFLPQRFYTKGKPTRWGSGPDSHDRDHYAFGWGRRFCQGSHMAEASLFIVLSRLVWGIDFEAPTDPVSGRPILPDANDEEGCWSLGFISVPKIYPVQFKARSLKHEELIWKAFLDVQSEWQTMGLAGDER